MSEVALMFLSASRHPEHTLSLIHTHSGGGRGRKPGDGAEGSVLTLRRSQTVCWLLGDQLVNKPTAL